jgi:signal transduction histidine kinase
LRLSTRFDPRRRVVDAEVADTGPGLSFEMIGHLFEPFYTTRAAGIGLGLAIAREITMAHHGQLQPVSKSGQQGAIFRLTLPTADTARAPG